MRNCHCDTDCQDDPGVKSGEARKCQRLREHEAGIVPKALVVDRLVLTPGSYMVTFPKELTAAQMVTFKTMLGIRS